MANKSHLLLLIFDQLGTLETHLLHLLLLLIALHASHLLLVHLALQNAFVALAKIALLQALLLCDLLAE